MIAPNNPFATNNTVNHDFFVEGNGVAAGSALNASGAMAVTATGALTTVGNTTITGAITTSNQTDNRFFSTFGTMILNGTIALGAGQDTYFAGPGNIVVNSQLTGSGAIRIAGSATK